MSESSFYSSALIFCHGSTQNQSRMKEGERETHMLSVHVSARRQNMDWYGAKNVGGAEKGGKTSEKAGAWQMEIGERHDLRAQSVLHSVALWRH